MTQDSYPLIAMDDVAPVFVRQLLLGAMTHRYLRRVEDLSYDEAFSSAMATWETPWESDPKPRGFNEAVEAVDSDLEHWDEA